MNSWHDCRVEPEELAGALKRLADWAAEHAPAPEPAVRGRLRGQRGVASLSDVSLTLDQVIGRDLLHNGADVDLVALRDSLSRLSRSAVAPIVRLPFASFAVCTLFNFDPQAVRDTLRELLEPPAALV
jgi:hypothetical protein